MLQDLNAKGILISEIGGDAEEATPVSLKNIML